MLRVNNNRIFSLRASVDAPDFPALEVEILKYWEKIDAFQTSLKMNKDKPLYTFYDGPPFATGLPHYGHILAGTIKVKFVDPLFVVNALASFATPILHAYDFCILSVVLDDWCAASLR